MKILIADRIPDEHVRALVDQGHECALLPDLDATTLPAAVGGHDVLVVRSTKVTAAAFDAAHELALVIRAGAGVNTIDWQAAADRGIYVCNTPGKNAVAVAELTIGLLTALDRRIPDAVADLRAGRWRKKEYSTARGLAGRTLGIVGCGDIGIAVASRARSLGMVVMVERKLDRRAEIVERIGELGIRLAADLPALLQASDVVSIHVPATDATRQMVDRRFLAQLRPGAFLINTSRGDIIDEAALLDAIEAKELKVGLDVYADEPASGTAEFDSALARHPNVYGTHHIGASTEQAQTAIADEVIAILDDFSHGVIRNCVNVRDQAEGTATLAVRHLNRVGVLARVLGVLRTSGLNVEQMENRVFSGGNAATATIHLAGVLGNDVVSSVAAEADVIGVSVAGS